MNNSIAQGETLIEAALTPFDFVRQVGVVIGFSLLTALAAQIVIPIGPVPITAQTFAVVLTGALLGSRLGAMAMIAYLLEGASGLPPCLLDLWSSSSVAARGLLCSCARRQSPFCASPYFHLCRARS